MVGCDQDRCLVPKLKQCWQSIPNSWHKIALLEAVIILVEDDYLRFIHMICSIINVVYLVMPLQISHAALEVVSKHDIKCHDENRHIFFGKKLS